MLSIVYFMFVSGSVFILFCVIGYTGHLSLFHDPFLCCGLFVFVVLLLFFRFSYLCFIVHVGDVHVSVVFHSAFLVCSPGFLSAIRFLHIMSSTLCDFRHILRLSSSSFSRFLFFLLWFMV